MPFAFWPTSPVVSQTWLDFLDFASAKADGTWLFRGHGDAGWDLFRRLAVSLPSRLTAWPTRRSCSRISCVNRNALSMRTGSRNWNGWRLRIHHGHPRVCSIDPPNPLLAAWFSIEEESLASDAKILALRVPFVRRVKTAQVFGSPEDTPLIVEVSPRVARLTAQEGCSLSAPRSAIAVAAFAAPLRHCGISGSSFGKGWNSGGCCIYSVMIRNGSLGIVTHSVRRWRGAIGNAEILDTDELMSLDELLSMGQGEAAMAGRIVKAVAGYRVESSEQWLALSQNMPDVSYFATDLDPRSFERDEMSETWLGRAELLLKGGLPSCGQGRPCKRCRSLCLSGWCWPRRAARFPSRRLTFILLTRVNRRSPAFNPR